jgi:hypothetical protein
LVLPAVHRAGPAWPCAQQGAPACPRRRAARRASPWRPSCRPWARRIIEVIRLGKHVCRSAWPDHARLRGGGGRRRAAAARERRAVACSALGPGGPAAAHAVKAARAQHGGCSSLQYLCAAARPLGIAGGSGARAERRPGAACRCGLGTAAAREGARRPKHTGCSGAGGRCVEVRTPRARWGWGIPPRRSCVSSLAREPAGGARVGRWAAAHARSRATRGLAASAVLCCMGLCLYWVYCCLLQLLLLLLLCRLCIWGLELERRPADTSVRRTHAHAAAAALRSATGRAHHKSSV